MRSGDETIAQLDSTVYTHNHLQKRKINELVFTDAKCAFPARNGIIISKVQTLKVVQKKEVCLSSVNLVWHDLSYA